MHDVHSFGARLTLIRIGIGVTATDRLEVVRAPNVLDAAVSLLTRNLLLAISCVDLTKFGFARARILVHVVVRAGVTLACSLARNVHPFGVGAIHIIVRFTIAPTDRVEAQVAHLPERFAFSGSAGHLQQALALVDGAELVGTAPVPVQGAILSVNRRVITGVVRGNAHAVRMRQALIVVGDSVATAHRHQGLATLVGHHHTPAPGAAAGPVLRAAESVALAGAVTFRADFGPGVEAAAARSLTLAIRLVFDFTGAVSLVLGAALGVARPREKAAE